MQWEEFLERAKSDKSMAHAAVDTMELVLRLTTDWPAGWGNSFFVEVFGSFVLRDRIAFPELGVRIDGTKQFSPSFFGASWFYEGQVAVTSRELGGFFDGIKRLEQVIGALHLASAFIGTNRGLGCAIHYRCRFLDNRGTGRLDLTGLATSASSILGDVQSAGPQAAEWIWKGIWWLRHGRRDARTGHHNTDLAVAYQSYWNAFECSVAAIEETIGPAPRLNREEEQVTEFLRKMQEAGAKPSVDSVKAAFYDVFYPRGSIPSRARRALDYAQKVKTEFDAEAAFVALFRRKPDGERLYQVRNDLDHGNVVGYAFEQHQRISKALCELSEIVIALLNAAAIGRSTGEHVHP